jgi:hypothetical protein
MVQYSSQLLNLFGAPELSELTVCGAKELSQLPDYLSAAIWNHILGAAHPDTSVRHLDLAFLRRTNAAAEEYSTGRSYLWRYIEGVEAGEHTALLRICRRLRILNSVSALSGKPLNYSIEWSTRF